MQNITQNRKWIKIHVKTDCFTPGFMMIISVPQELDTEEYIDAFLEHILNEDLRYNCEWDFAD